MNKQELIDNIAASADITKAAAARALDSVIDSVTNSLKKDDSVGDQWWYAGYDPPYRLTGRHNEAWLDVVKK